MNEKVKALLRRIAFQLRAALDGDELALEELSEVLAGSDVPGDELAAAFEAILALTDANREDLPEGDAPSRGNRVLSLEERSRLTPEAYGYLLGARGAGSIDDEQFEWVLERALASSAFSNNSLTTEAGRSITSPAAICEATSGESKRIGIQRL